MALAWERYTEQLEWLTTPTQEEIDVAKSMLNKYRRLRGKVDDFKKNPPETDKQLIAQKKAELFTRSIERAVNLIPDPNIRAVIDYRFIDGNSRAATMIRFSGWNYCDKTIDRKIQEGIESVAFSLRDI